MEITLSELLEGKSTIIKNKEFFPTKTYVEPFIERMSKFTDNFKINVKLPDQMTTSQNTPDLAFNRVWIQAILPQQYSIDSHDEVIGMVYGIDPKKPIVKIYRGMLNSACTNLTVFNPQWQSVQELVPGEVINYAPMKNLMEMTSDFAIKLEQLKSTYIGGGQREREQELGKWVNFTIKESEEDGFGKVKLANSVAIDAFKQLYIDTDSPYYTPPGMETCLFDAYNAFTQVITDDKKDLMNKFTKTILISRLLGVTN